MDASRAPLRPSATFAIGVSHGAGNPSALPSRRHVAQLREKAGHRQRRAARAPMNPGKPWYAEPPRPVTMIQA